MLRLCLKDKTSVLIECDDIENLRQRLNNDNFVGVINHNTGKEELYNRDHIWCVRKSSKENNNDNSM